MSKVYILRGSYGSYDDHSDWIVAVYNTKEAAETRLELCQTFADSIEDVASNYGKQSPHDPHYYKDYGGVIYAIDTYNLIEDDNEIVYQENYKASAFTTELGTFEIQGRDVARSIYSGERIFRYLPIVKNPTVECLEISITVKKVAPKEEQQEA